MKKSLILFSVLFCLSGCRCLLSQIPAQFVYAEEGCQASLPNYVPLVHAFDNCILNSVVQTPVPGTILNSLQMVTRVEIKATDGSGNSSTIHFDVILADTIPPVFDDSLLVSADYDKMDALYTQADRIVKEKVLNADARFPYWQLGITNLQDTVFYVVREIKLKGQGSVAYYSK